MDTDSFEEQLREGEERLAKGQAAEAVSCLQRCVELRPDDARARLSLGQALSESGRDAASSGSSVASSGERPQNRVTKQEGRITIETALLRPFGNTLAGARAAAKSLAGTAAGV